MKVVFPEPARKMYTLCNLYDLINKDHSKNLILTLSKIQQTWHMILLRQDKLDGGDGSYQGALKVSGLVDLMNTYHHAGRCPKGTTLSDHYKGTNEAAAREEGLAFLNVFQLVPAGKNWWIVCITSCFGGLDSFALLSFPFFTYYHQQRCLRSDPSAAPRQ